MDECRSDINCSMVSSSNCQNTTSEYHLCGQTSEMVPNVQACHYRKNGNFTHNEIAVTKYLILGHIYII